MPLAGHGLHVDHGHADRRGDARWRHGTWPGRSRPRWAFWAAGCRGAQTCEALKCAFPVKQVMAYDAAPENAVRYAAGDAATEIGGAGVKVTVVDDPRHAVSRLRPGRDRRPDPAAAARDDQGRLAGPGRVCFTGGLRFLLGSGRAAGGRQVLHGRRAAAGVLPELRLLPVDPARSTRASGNWSPGQKPGRESATERTIGCNLGLALDDMATAPIVYRRAVERGIGTWLEL